MTSDRSRAPGASRGFGWKPSSRRIPHGLLAFLSGSSVALLLMMHDGQFSFGVPLGFLACSIAAFGLLDVLGGYEPRAGAPVVDVEPRLGRWLVVAAAAIAAFVATTRLAVAGTLPGRGVLASILIPIFLLAALYATYQCARWMGVFGDPGTSTSSPLHHGSFWILAATIALFVPTLGSFSLIDPWETHYGEVAREILARDDWISLWWAQDGWFWSKPVLDHWLQALSFAVFGVRYQPDSMIEAASHGLLPQPEWAARLPMLACTLLAEAALYAGVAKAWGRRAAIAGTLTWITVPYFTLIGRQSMTDLPYIAGLCMAMGFWLRGFAPDTDRVLHQYRLRIRGRDLHFSAHSLLFGVIILLTLPQILYLVSRNLTLDLQWPWSLQVHADRFFAGSGGGNCGIPGNQLCARAVAAYRRPEPAVVGLAFGAILSLALVFNRKEHQLERIYFLAAAVGLALSALAKGLPGPVIAAVTLAAWLTATRRWRQASRWPVLSAALVFVAIALPWFVEMTLRHGVPFLERLFVHDMYKRAFIHVHDTNAGQDVSIRYYLWQLGYGLFPATGLCAAGLLYWHRSNDDATDDRQRATVMLVLWSVVAFGMFTVSRTKFHHYVIPLVPPVALLTGLIFDDAVDTTRWPAGRRAWAYGIGTFLAAVVCLQGIVTGLGGSWLGTPTAGSPTAGHVVAGTLLVGAGLVATLLLGRRFTDELQPSQPGSHRAIELGVLGLVAATLTFAVAPDLCGASTRDGAGAIRLIHLVCYNYSRPWPETLSFGPVLTAFAVVATVLCLGLVLPSRLRAHAMTMLGATMLVWSGWVANGYTVMIAPHWGQRDTILEYYRRRANPDEFLVAYQMNWKGENFYTGNRLPAFVTTGERFTKWIEEQRRRGRRVLFFTTEHSRLAGLKSELGKVRRFETLTTRALNNKFVLTRVEL